MLHIFVYRNVAVLTTAY